MAMTWTNPMLMLGMSIVFEAQNEPEANSTLPMENLAVAGMPNSSTQLDPNPQWGTGIIYPCSIFVAKRSAQPDGHTRATWHPHNTYTSPSHIPTLRALPSSPLSGFSLFCSCFVAYCMIADVASGCIPMYYAFLHTVFSCIPDSYACSQCDSSQVSQFYLLPSRPTYAAPPARLLYLTKFCAS